MKTIKINEHSSCKVHDRCESYDVVIDNVTKKVKKFHCRFLILDKKGIQELVDKLIKNEMITIFGKDTTNVHIQIWDIGDGSDELYIETFHINPELPETKLFDDHDRSMKYDDFIKL